MMDKANSGVCKNCNNHIREKLVELLSGAVVEQVFCSSDGHPVSRLMCRVVDDDDVDGLADYLIANGVTVQETAYWKDVTQINGECFGYCSNCLTDHKAQNYAVLVMSHRHCRWCGRRLITTPFTPPPKGE